MSRHGGLFGPDPIGYDGEGWQLVEQCERGERNTDAFRYLLPERSREIERELREYVERNRSRGNGYDRLLEKYENIADEIHIIRMQRLQEEREQQKRMKDYIKRGDEERSQKGRHSTQSFDTPPEQTAFIVVGGITLICGAIGSYIMDQSGDYSRADVLTATVLSTVFLPLVTGTIAYMCCEKKR